MGVLEVEATGEAGAASWAPARTYAPKAGLDATLRGSVVYAPAGYTFDIDGAIAAGGITTQDPYLQGAVESSGCFDLVS